MIDWPSVHEAHEARDGRPGADGGVIHGGLAGEGAVLRDGHPGRDAKLVVVAPGAGAGPSPGPGIQVVAGDARVGVAEVDGRRGAQIEGRRRMAVVVEQAVLRRVVLDPKRRHTGMGIPNAAAPAARSIDM